VNVHQREKLVLFGMMARRPVAGVVWQTIHYLIGFQRLGYDVYYVEAHGATPMMFMKRSGDDGSSKAAAFIASVMRHFDLGDRWAFHALHSDGRCYGLSESRLKQLYHSASLLVNLHGGTRPLPEHSATDRLVYLETDPVAVQIKLHQGVRQIIDFLEAHCAFFTFAENYGNPDCKLPVSSRFDFRPTRQPVVVDLWRPYGKGAGHAFSTVGSWRQFGREVTFRGEVYQWSKHSEFRRFLDLPARTNRTFELALTNYSEADKRRLEGKGWRVRDALSFSMNTDAYRRYVAHSRGEFSVAKDQNVRLRSGWFSDRSASYLAAGRPVITQETGFSNILPTGQGLFAFSEMEEIVQALASIDSAYEHHRRAAAAVAQEYFRYDVVLSQLLADLGLPHSTSRLRKRMRTKTDEDVTDQELTHLGGGVDEPSGPLSPTLVLTPTSRRPTALPEATVQSVLRADPAPTSLARYDVVWFPSADRNSDPQESQQTMGQLAHRGHRVFCIKTDADLPPNATQDLRMRVIAPNLFEARLAAAHRPGVRSEAIDPKDTVFLKALGALRAAYSIHAAVTYVQASSWSSVAIHAWERWGWKVVYDCSHEQEGSSPAINHSLTEQERILEREAHLVIKREAALRERENDLVGASIAASRESTCAERWQRLDRSIRATFKRASIVIVTFDNLLYTKLCVESLLANTEYPNYEVILVDNDSTDGTPAYLRSMMQQYPHVRVIFNADNVGFARANNQGLARASGDVVVLLNNDTLVPRGWLTRLVQHLEDPSIGLIGPVTNRIGNEAQIEVPYHTYAGFVQFAKEYTEAREGELFDIRTLCMFCSAIRRGVYERIGVLDERFEVGTLEDDDYSMRVRAAGYRVVCAEDVFVHHFGEASFGKLVSPGEYGRLLRANRRRFDEKWGIPWEPYRRRANPRYQQLVGRIREIVSSSLPAESTVLVVSKGDEELLKLDGRRAWHFPQTEDGTYAGHYPANSAAAIAHLEALRAKGADFLLFPNTAFWWLEHYPEFRQHLESRYPVVELRQPTCLIFAMNEAADGYPHSA
jgi:GT2 family glycosyltransferase